MKTPLLVCCLTAIVPSWCLADGPHIAPGEEDQVVADNLAAPSHYDIFYGKKDRQYLTGVWKLQWAWNFLTREWISQNMVDRKVGKEPQKVLREGVQAPYKEIAPGAEQLDLRADISQWWDVLVPGVWNRGFPYEEADDRDIADYYVKHIDAYAFGGVGFYRKSFHVPQEKAGRRVVLHLGSVESDCVVWVNGKQVGEHRNWRQRGLGRVPGAFMDFFDLEITDAIEFGQENLLTVRVYDTGVPFVWTRTDPGGITGLVWLEYFPRSYFKEVMITAPFGEDKLTVNCLPAAFPVGRASQPDTSAAPERVSVEVTPWESEDYVFPGEPKRSFQEQVALSAPDAEGWRSFEMAVPGICAWDVSSPCLYELRITAEQGLVIGLERFGVRTIETRGRQFLLNGKPVYFFGHCAGDSLLPGWGEAPASTPKEGYNYHNLARKLLRAYREMNFTSLRVHTGPHHRGVYHFCDELGFMVRDEWTPAALQPLPPEQQLVDYLGTHDVSASFTADKSAFLPDLREKLKRWVHYHYNSPCVVTWSGGNEMGAGEPNIRRYAELLYEFLHAHDPQQRPVTHASGLHWERGEPELKSKPLPADYLDYHNYQMIYSRWIDAARSYNAEYDDLFSIYAGQELPVINGEWLAHGGKADNLCVITPEIFDEDGNPTVEGYVKLIADLKARREPYTHHRISREYLARLAVGGSRIARSYQADAEARGRYYHRAVEIFRRDCPREAGYSFFALKRFVLERVDAERKRIANEYGSPEMAAIRMAQQHLIAIPDFWEEHIFAEDGLSFDAHVINWSREDFRGEMQVSLQQDGSEPVAQATVSVETLQVGERAVMPVTLRLKPDSPPGSYQLVLELKGEGHDLSRNVHRVLVRGKTEFAPFAATRRVALYEVPQGADTAAALLETTGVQYDRLTDLADLSVCEVLVLGRDSVDATVSRNARALRDFVEAGGRIIAFEQDMSGQIPWAPAMYYEKCGPVPNADPIPLEHPIFRGMSAAEFEDWGRDHVLYTSLLQPWGPNLLAGGAGPRIGFVHSSAPDFGMAVVEFRMGEGACLLSQLRVTETYRTDSAARAFGYNLLHYALATPWETADIPPLAGDTGGVSDQPILSLEQVHIVNFRKKCNRTVEDRDGQGWMGLREGLHDIPRGVKLFGGVPFRVDDSALVLGASPKHPEPVFPAEMKEIGVWKSLKRLYFLHTAAWVSAAEGEELLRYVVHYADGKTADFVVNNRVDLADWYQAKSHTNARVVWFSGRGKSIFLSEWENPRPAQKIKWLDIVTAGKAYVGVLAMTGVLQEADG